MIFATLQPSCADTFTVLEMIHVHDEQTSETLLKRLKSAANEKPHHSVKVVAVNSLAYDYRLARCHGAAKPIEVGMRFPTAADASRHMGYGNNQVANRLGKARRAGQATATICGVTWQREELVRIDESS